MIAHNADHIIEAPGAKDFTIERQTILVKALRIFLLKILVYLVHYIEFDREVAIRADHSLRALVFLSDKFYGTAESCEVRGLKIHLVDFFGQWWKWSNSGKPLDSNNI